MTKDEEASSRDDWKRYPYPLSLTDPELIFPLAEGDQGAESNTYYVAGRLRGRESRRDWAFLVIFTANDIAHRLRADFYTFALFDLATGEHGTYTAYDLPRPLRRRTDYRLSVARGRLDVSFRCGLGRSTWTTRAAPDGSPLPFDYHLDLCGRDAAWRRMRLVLDLETRKPPLPVGAEEYGGVKTCMGQQGTHSYFQSDVRFSGTLEWGDVAEEVDGDCGWIDRQWAPRYLGLHTGLRNRRYRHEWRQIHLDNGVELGVWMHFDRRRGNRLIPFSGATIADAAGRVATTAAFELERLSFVRDPRAVEPRYRLTDGGTYFADRYRLRVPEWRLDLVSEPLAPVPAHALPIEYWSGPTRLSGTMNGLPVEGFGFHERTRVFSRDFELVEVLRDTLRHLPDDAAPPAASPPLRIANLAWEIDGYLGHGDYEGALRYLRERVRPELERLAPPHVEHLLTIADDLAEALHRWWVRD
ncbi:MAG: lipocalin-like domain-containing protein, partial [Candidatus Binatia bacterium]